MSSVVIVSKPGPDQRPFAGARARWVAAAIVVLGPLLQMVEFSLEDPPSSNSARVSAWVEHPDRIGASMAAGLLAVPFLIGGVAVLVALTRVHTRGLAWAAAGLLTCGMVGLAGIHGFEMAAFSVAKGDHERLAVSILDGTDVGLPGAVLLVLFLGGAVLGTLALLWPLWRSPWLPRVVVLFILGFAVLDFALSSPLVSHLVNLVGLTIVAYAVVTRYSRDTT
jgi:hypothetical protein